MEQVVFTLKFIFIYVLLVYGRYLRRKGMQSLKIDDPRDFKQKIFWCLFWANRKAIRTEGCAPLVIEKIVANEVTYAPEPGAILRLSHDLLKKIEEDMKVGNVVAFTIKMGAETFDMSFKNNVFSISTRKNKDMEAEIIECLGEEMRTGKPKICSSFPQRIGSDMKV
jgi:hypothetical protein